MLASIGMPGAAVLGILESTGGRTAVEAMAGAAEVMGLLFRMGTMKAHDWLNYCTMANKMVNSLGK